MSMFIGNTFIRTEDVRGTYRNIDTYDTTDEENKDLGDVVLLDGFNNRISEIEVNVNSIIKTLEKYDLQAAIDELKILAEKLY